MKSKKLIKELINNSFYGIAIGDALGVPVEFCSRGALENYPVVNMIGNGTYNQPKGTFSDDTSLTFATAMGLCNRKNIRHHIANEFVKWYKDGEYAINNKVFDVGNTTAKAIGNFILTNSVSRMCEPIYHQNGNGSLMRIMPVAFYLYNNSEYDTIEKRKIFISDISALTHKHIISKICCVIYVEIALEIIKQQINNNFSIDNLLDTIKIVIEKVYHTYTLNSIIEMYISELNNIFHYDIFDYSRDKVNSSGYVINTLESVLWCITHTHSFIDAMLTAVNLGGDTDTIGSLTGGLAGLIYSFDTIPNGWIDDLQGRDIIDTVVKRFSKYIIKHNL